MHKNSCSRKKTRVPTTLLWKCRNLYFFCPRAELREKNCKFCARAEKSEPYGCGCCWETRWQKDDLDLSYRKKHVLGIFARRVDVGIVLSPAKTIIKNSRHLREKKKWTLTKTFSLNWNQIILIIFECIRACMCTVTCEISIEIHKNKNMLVLSSCIISLNEKLSNSQMFSWKIYNNKMSQTTAPPWSAFLSLLYIAVI